VSRDDSGLLVVPGSVTGEFEDLGREVWRHKRESGKEGSASRQPIIPERTTEDRSRKELLTLEDGSKVDGSTGTHSLGVVSLLEETVDTTDGELETSLGGSRDGLLAVSTLGGGSLAGLSLARPEGGEGRKGPGREVGKRTGRAKRYKRRERERCLHDVRVSGVKSGWSEEWVRGVEWRELSESWRWADSGCWERERERGGKASFLRAPRAFWLSTWSYLERDVASFCRPSKRERLFPPASLPTTTTSPTSLFTSNSPLHSLTSRLTHST
jgi:hypothetical protein